jgi:hypothetical protein
MGNEPKVHGNGMTNFNGNHLRYKTFLAYIVFTS